MELIDQTCRLCFSYGDCHISIFNNSVSSLNIAQAIRQHFQWEVDEKDVFPNAVCVDCWMKTDSFHKFHQLVMSARDGFLKQLRRDAVKEKNYSPMETIEVVPVDYALRIKTEPMAIPTDTLNDLSHTHSTLNANDDELMPSTPQANVTNECDYSNSTPLESWGVMSKSEHNIKIVSIQEAYLDNEQKTQLCEPNFAGRSKADSPSNTLDFLDEQSNDEANSDDCIMNETDIQSQNKYDEPCASTSAKQQKNWIHHKTVYNFNELQQFLAHEKCWSVFTKSTAGKGATKYYRCNRVPKGSKIQCAASIKVFEPSDTVNFQIFRSDMEHNHDQISNKKISPEIKKQIMDMRKKGMKPRDIQKRLKSSQNGNTMIPTRKQLVNILNYNKDVIKTELQISLEELIKWMGSKSKSPSHPDQPFIVKFTYSKSGDNGQSKNFRFVASTIRLLQNARNVSTMCTDGTNKIVWNGYPLFAIGATDMGKRFHPIAFALCANENGEDFHFIFETIKNAVLFYTQQPFEPKLLISDGSETIINAFYNVFDTASNTIMCYAHILQNVAKQKLEKNIQKDIKHDLNKLQLAPSKKSFENGVKLFLNKWKTSEPEFCDNFEKQWIDRNSNWYEGAAYYTPSTNNALAAFNNVIKTNYLLRVRQPFKEFKRLFFRMLLDISTRYTEGETKFSHEPKISLQEWRKAFDWAMDMRIVPIKVDEDDDKIEYYVPSSEHFIEHDRELTWSDIENYSNSNWTSFEDFNKCSSMWHLKIHKKDWNTKSECSCRRFLKDFICKHKIGMAIRHQFTTPPAEAQPNEKPRRGRVPQPKKAMIV